MTDPSVAWSLGRRLAFRFAAIYFALYSLATLGYPLGLLPGLSQVNELWTASLPYVGELLGIAGPIPLEPSGSGDTTVEYLRVAMILALALLGSLAWTLLDRERDNYRRLAAWLIVWARYWLGSAMVLYGLYKLFKMQFPFPDVIRLAEPYGESSPMGLAWAFMGYSTPYNIFTGGAEVLGGALLLWRRTTSLGALVCVGVMANVAMLNFSYDIPVKLYSSHLLLVALGVLVLDRERLFAALLSSRAIPARELPELLPERRKLRIASKSVYIVSMVGLAITEIVVSGRQLGIDVDPPLYGLYDVTIDARDDASDESARWRQLAIGRYGRISVYPLHGRGVGYLVQIDADAHTLELTPREGEATPSILHYEEPEPGVLLLDGTLDGVHHRASLRRIDETQLLLVERGFHWITEQPFNR